MTTPVNKVPAGSNVSRPFPRVVALSLLAASLAASLTACGNAAQRLGDLGEKPAMTNISDPTQQPGYKPVSMPVPPSQPNMASAGSIWQPGARAFFKDQRAKTVGDTLTITVDIDDSAKLDNKTQNTRADTDQSGMTNLFGLEKLLPAVMTPSSLINTNTALSTDGEGQVNRSEQINLKIAALVTQVLPNGNLVIVARQEVRVNYDVRELQVTGIVRPTDIDTLDTIDYAKIAEARISYGGHGQQDNLQQPHYGTQLLDTINPF